MNHPGERRSFAEPLPLPPGVVWVKDEPQLQENDRLDLSNSYPIHRSRSGSSFYSPSEYEPSVAGGGFEEESLPQEAWLSVVMCKHPDLITHRELLSSLAPKIRSYSLFYSTARTIRANVLKREDLLQLCMSHMKQCNYETSIKVLEEESGIKYCDGLFPIENGLSNLLVLGVPANCDIWAPDLTNTLFADDVFGIDTKVMKKSGGGDDDNGGCPMWKEPEDSSLNLLFSKPTPAETEIYSCIRAGTLNKLVERLTAPAVRDVGGLQKYVKTFLMTYRSFTSAEVLLDKLKQRYWVARLNMDNAIMQQIIMRVCVVLETWLKAHPQDFNTTLTLAVDDLIEQDLCCGDGEKATMRATAYFAAVEGIEVKERYSDDSYCGSETDSFRSRILSDDDEEIGMPLIIVRSLDAKAEKLMSAYIKKLRGLVRRLSMSATERETMFSELAPDPRIPPEIFSESLTIFDVDPLELARQLSLLEFQCYSAIRPSELLNLAWSKPKLKHRSPNILWMISRFNNVSMWVATLCITPETCAQRSNVMRYFIDVCEELSKLNNFNTLMAICAGLNNASVTRLKHSRAEIPQERVDFFNSSIMKLMSSSSSYKNYRDALHNADPPCIPYLGTYLTDLTFIEDGNQDMINDLINMTKRGYYFDVILEVQQYQLKPYNLQEVYQIQQLIKDPLEFMEDNPLYKLSLQREPRGKKREDIL